ncbi:hypothetical protein SARC_11777 [Sphaeroforma arctica JP610]|uniref:Uncharacterized protein n=1 Tax=Sphaeroforma arctica JP610 TaxID=667725 RepID=A0A0L0FI48_9EUKA|nr:hypothetical protein SARC_11777 [Sphaeroforma arctica JP610]KNC75703.1 hypothetical protein SARC_11777 [Sphaeroforma arctica JP610]|eukprot:XP_014149605.1 hypothetical protein SARC_11777 [Sphaeroforma arctica JP610]
MPTDPSLMGEIGQSYNALVFTVTDETPRIKATGPPYLDPQLSMLEDRAALMLESKVGAVDMVALDLSKAITRHVQSSQKATADKCALMFRCPPGCPVWEGPFAVTAVNDYRRHTIRDDLVERNSRNIISTSSQVITRSPSSPRESLVNGSFASHLESSMSGHTRAQSLVSHQECTQRYITTDPLARAKKLGE